MQVETIRRPALVRGVGTASPYFSKTFEGNWPDLSAAVVDFFCFLVP
jgi:hypothetical protein